jgi:hypothetical protein
MSDQANRNPQQGNEQKSDHEQKQGSQKPGQFGQPKQPGQGGPSSQHDQQGQSKQPGQSGQSKNPQPEHETDDQAKRKQA